MCNFITISSKKIKNKEQFENISHEMNRTPEYMTTKQRTNIDPSKSHLNAKLLENKYKDFISNKYTTYLQSFYISKCPFTSLIL